MGWVASLGAQLALAGGVGVWESSQTTATHPPAWSSAALACVLTVCVVAIAMFIRNEIYKANWRGHAITAQGYVTGNMVFLAILTAVPTAAVGTAVWRGAASPAFYPIAVCVLVQATNFPTGRPTRPAPPRIASAVDTERPEAVGHRGCADRCHSRG